MSDGWSIGEVPLMLPGEERTVGTRARDGDDAARQEMVRRNLPLAMHVAKSMPSRGWDLADMAQAGVPGLYRAAINFDPARGCRFSTYAYHWIRNAIQKAQDAGALVRIPARAWQLYLAAGKAEAAMGADARSVDEVAGRLGVSAPKLLLAMRARRTVSFWGDGEDAISPHGDPAVDAEDADDLSAAAQALAALPYLERVVIERTVMGDETLAILAEEWGCTWELVWQFRSAGLAMLRQRLRVEVTS